MRYRCLLPALVLATLFFSAQSFGRDDVPQATPGAGLTIYMDISAVGKTDRAASRMTDLHKQHFVRGWKVIDVDPYVEDGDLQGFFITYVGMERPALD